jgi:4-hydroxy-tetrahydrodipicolinate reductase
MQEQGVGLTPEAFQEGVEKGELAGHVGFAESVGMISHALGWRIDEFGQQMAPILTEVDRKSPCGFAARGNVAGVNMTGQGYIDGKVKIT